MSSDQRSQVLSATDLVELISQSVALKRMGTKYKGLCPFHSEKTPSFTVDPAKQYFYCFGCKASGTAFDFVMKRDRVEFREALEILASRAGIELKFGGGEKSNKGERQALLEVNSAAARFFDNLLNQPSQQGQAQAEAARQYLLEKRGFTPETLKKFQAGLAVDAWDMLLRGPVGRKFGPQLLHQAGLVKARDGGNGFYDTFRNRIMFPIRNESGQTIAFGGRVMPGSQDPAKYLNSPETPLFSKSKSIFGLDLGRQRIVETRTVAVVEGYTDVMMAHQFGASNVVSVLGTAMTPQHVGILQRFADRIVLLFDADNAGDAAVDRVLQLFLTQEIEIAVATLPDGLDPDEFFLKFGMQAFDKLLADASDALTYAWKQMKKRFVSHEGDLTGQQKAIEEYLELLAGARGTSQVNPVRWGLALSGVSTRTGIPTAELHRRFANSVQKGPKMAPQAMNGMNRGYEHRPNGSGGNSMPAPAYPPSRRGPIVLDAQARAERWVLGVVLSEPHRWYEVQAVVQLDDFTDPVRKDLAQRIWEYQRDEGETVLSEFLSALPEESLRALAIELSEEVERMQGEAGSHDVTIRSAAEHLVTVRRKREEEGTFLARADRLAERQADRAEGSFDSGNDQPSDPTSDEILGGNDIRSGSVAAKSGQDADGKAPEPAGDEVELLKRIQEKARTPDLRRGGR